MNYILALTDEEVKTLIQSLDFYLEYIARMHALKHKVDELKTQEQFKSSTELELMSEARKQVKGAVRIKQGDDKQHDKATTVYGNLSAQVQKVELDGDLKTKMAKEFPKWRVEKISDDTQARLLSSIGRRVENT
jgi:hypothetical protein